MLVPPHYADFPLLANLVQGIYQKHVHVLMQLSSGRVQNINCSAGKVQRQLGFATLGELAVELCGVTTNFVP